MSDEETPRSVKPQIKTTKKQNPSRRRQQQNRHMGYRTIKNQEFTARQDSLMKQKLQPLFEQELYPSSGPAQVVDRTLPLPTSTAAIGHNIFITLKAAFTLNNTIVITRSMVLALYRHSLNIMAARWQTITLRPNLGGGYIIPSVPAEMVPHLNVDAWNLLLVGHFIDGLGPVNLQDGERYVPVLPDTPRVQGQLLPRPDAIHIGNLREVVMALSNQNVVPAVRQTFFQHNPIPGARWANDLLLNMDEIMPEVYGIDQMRNDAAVADNLISTIQRLVPKLVRCRNNNTAGSLSQLATVQFDEPQFIPSFPGDDPEAPVGPFISNIPFSGGRANIYFKLRSLTTPELKDSLISAYGVWPDFPAGRIGISSSRNPDYCSKQLREDRRALISSIFGVTT